MMLHLSEYSLLLGADSACAALAIRIHMRDEGSSGNCLSLLR